MPPRPILRARSPVTATDDRRFAIGPCLVGELLRGDDSEPFLVPTDPDFIEAGNDAVAEGKVESLSAWVNAALAERVARERRLARLRKQSADDSQAFFPRGHTTMLIAV